MDSKLAKLLQRHKAKPVTPDIKAMQDGIGDLRYAMGISHLPEDQPVVYFLFQNADRGPEQRFWEERPEAPPADALNHLSMKAARRPGSRRHRQAFDHQHYLETQSQNSRPTMVANRAMAFSIEDHKQFEQVALKAGRAFLADADGAADLSLTVLYLPPVDPKATAASSAYQITFTPNLNPVRVLPPEEDRGEQALRGEQGQKAWDVAQAAIKKLQGKVSPK